MNFLIVPMANKYSIRSHFKKYSISMNNADSTGSNKIILHLKPITCGTVSPHLTSIKPKEYVINEDGTIAYVEREWISKSDANQLMILLRQQVEFERHPIMMYGKSVMQPRKTFSCGNPNLVHNYSGLSLELKPWCLSPEILNIRDNLLGPLKSLDLINIVSTYLFADIPPSVKKIKEIADRIQEEFKFDADSCLANEYKTGAQYIGYHGDRETRGAYNNLVVTVSLGGPRDFCFKRNSNGEVRKVLLNSGDLCIMAGRCQEDWKHSIPKRAKANYRISLTYRQLGHRGK